MSGSLNRVLFIGNLGGDPDMRYLDNGDAVCNFSVAATESWKDKQSGERQERTEWLRVTAFQRQAEICGEYLKKGSKVYVEGKLQTRSYEKDGVTRYVTECRLERMVMLSSRGDTEGEGQQRSGSAPAPRPQQRSAAPTPRQQRQGGFDDMDDDIPF